MDIHDWWNRARREDGALKLSSRRMLIFLDQLPEDSPFREVATEDWSFSKKLLAANVNELRIMRAENIVAGGGEFQEPQLIKTPAQELADQFDAEQKQQIRIGILSQLHQGV